MSPNGQAEDATLCEECQEPIEMKYSQWEPEDVRVCTSCWFRELDGETRKQYAKEAHERRQERLNS